MGLRKRRIKRERLEILAAVMLQVKWSNKKIRKE